MKRNQIDISYLNNVINSTIQAVEKGQSEVFHIAEHVKQECERIEKELDSVKEKVRGVIDKVDLLQKMETNAKYNLMKVSKDFKKYTEEDIKAAYDEAKDVQIKLYLEKEREKQLREKRNDLERSYMSMSTILQQAEQLTMQIGVALSFLKNNLEDVSGHISDATQKRIFAAQIIKAQEEERKRVARDIHDGPAQTMANVIIEAELCEKLFEKDLDEAKKELNELKSVVRGSLKELRKIIFNLRPSALDDLGLEAVTRRCCAEFEEDTGIDIDLKIFGDKIRINPSIEVTLFRIIQEALSNIKKHSHASHATIKLEISNDFVNLLIADNGIGFELDLTVESLMNKRHFGIMNIKERAELFNGTLKIETSPGENGTKIFITIPLKEERR